jgi:uncharacterized membrane protein YfcA
MASGAAGERLTERRALDFGSASRVLHRVIAQARELRTGRVHHPQTTPHRLTAEPPRPTEPPRMILSMAALMVVSFVAGSVNSVAGGGTLLTFPTLLALHLPSIAANATSTVALVPGSFAAFLGYRRGLTTERADLFWFGVPSLLGGIAGAWLLVRTTPALFDLLVPWLILGATGLFIVQEPLQSWRVRRHARDAGGASSQPLSPPTRAVAALVQLVVAVYGGFFGAGMGIVMLAGMGMLGMRDIHTMNRLKNLCAVAVNGVAAATFIIAGQVHWAHAIVMGVAATVGGYWGAGVAQRVGAAWARRFIVTVGLVLGTYTLARRML